MGFRSQKNQANEVTGIDAAVTHPPPHSVDHSALAASVFHKQADAYRAKFADLTLYHNSYRSFCALLKPGHARVLDAACGPGHVSKYLLAQRPELDLLGIDLAPRMVELAREAVPSAHFLVYDCRRVLDLQRRFDGIISAFGLPYLAREEAAAFIRAASQVLDSGGALYLSTMLGNCEDSGFQCASTGDRIYVNYHSETQVMGWLEGCGFTILQQNSIPSPSAATKATTDLIVIARK